MRVAALRSTTLEVMGTVFTFTWWPEAVDLGDALGAAATRLREIDAAFSTWKPDSPLSRLRRGEPVVGDHPEIAAVLGLCRELRGRSGGWFDPWAAPGGVDPTGMVKGWATGEACALLGAAGAPAALVNGGGDVATLPGSGPEGAPCWQVGIRHPWRPEALAGVVEVPAGGAVASSGTYERPGHLWRPRGDGPLPGLAATVCGPEPTAADAFATALAAGGEDFLRILETMEGWEGWLVTPDGTEHETAGFPWA